MRFRTYVPHSGVLPFMCRVRNALLTKWTLEGDVKGTSRLKQLFHLTPLLSDATLPPCRGPGLSLLVLPCLKTLNIPLDAPAPPVVACLPNLGVRGDPVPDGVVPAVASSRWLTLPSVGGFQLSIRLNDPVGARSRPPFSRLVAWANGSALVRSQRSPSTL